MARTAWERGWRPEALRPARLDSLPPHSLPLREHRGTFLHHRLPREAAAGRTLPWPEFSPDSSLLAWAPCTPDSMPRGWRIWPFLSYSSPGQMPPTAITPRLWAYSVGSA